MTPKPKTSKWTPFSKSNKAPSYTPKPGEPASKQQLDAYKKAAKNK